MRSGPCSLGTRAAPILHNRGATGKGAKRKTVMRKQYLMLLAAAFGLAASQASAADVPRKAPAVAAPAAPPTAWTGCYIGANVGGTFGRAETTFGFGEVSTHNSGFAGGGQIGCDYQFAGGWVVGVRNMFDGTSLHKDRAIAFGPLAGGEVDFKTRWFDTLTGRVGYAAAPAWLIYGQGGGAWAQSSSAVTFAGVQIGDFSKTRSGWTAGGGVEWMFAPRWSAFLEGNYMDFGSNDQTVITPVSCPAGCAFNTKATAATALVGVNYRFGWGKAPY
jgi:outer membrane immunogenic protein